MKSIKSKLITLAVIITLGPLALLSAFNYMKTTEFFTASAEEFLMTIAKSKADALGNYIETTKISAKMLAKTDVFQRYISLSKQPADERDAAQMNASKKEVENLLYSFQEVHWGRYHHVFLIDRTRKIVISPNHGGKLKGSPSSHLNEDVSNNSWAVEALIMGEDKISDYSSWTESDHNHQMLFSPVKDSSGKTHAIIGFELEIPHEQKILAEDFTLGETGRIFLTTLDGYPIAYDGVESKSPVRSKGFYRALIEGKSFGKHVNERGVTVVDLYLKSDKYPWILAVEIEEEEAFGPIHKMQLYVITGLILMSILAFILATLLANYITRPIKDLAAQMEKVSIGELDIKVDYLDREDEIGGLAYSFNRILISLKLVMDRYKKLKNKGV